MLRRILERLPRAISGAMPICALISSPIALSQETILSRENLEAALEKSVMCNTNALNKFYGADPNYGPDDARQQLETLGVTITNESRHGGEIRFRFPSGVKVFSYEANEAIFFGESTTLFFVTLHADSNQLSTISKKLRLTPIPKGNPDGYGYFGEFDVRYIRKLRDNKDLPSFTIFSGVENSRDYIVIGCQNLAW